MNILNVNKEIVFLELDNSRWGDMERLFESRGGPKNCWCMVWRGTSRDRADKISRKAAILQLIEEDVPVGIIGYLGDVPIAWCSIAPRSTYRDLGGLKEPGEDSEKVWSIVCFFVNRKYRGQGIMNRLIDAAVEHSCKRGATVIEAYPVDPDSPSYRFMGFVPYFEDRGFVKVGIAGSRRHVMRLKL
jgi:GNAT superfamily N-acetyltransferase